MDEAAMEARRRYRREYYHKNKDKAKLYMERYWNKKALQLQKGKAVNEEAQAAR